MTLLYDETLKFIPGTSTDPHIAKFLVMGAPISIYNLHLLIQVKGTRQLCHSNLHRTEILPLQTQVTITTYVTTVWRKRGTSHNWLHNLNHTHTQNSFFHTTPFFLVHTYHPCQKKVQPKTCHQGTHVNNVHTRCIIPQDVTHLSFRILGPETLPQSPLQKEKKWY